MKIPKMCLKHYVLTPGRFYRRFCPWLSLQTVFLAVQTLTLLFSLAVPNFEVFFRVIKLGI